jgi:hypothetical protein
VGVIDPRAYTSGRWLRQDKVERDSRFIKFNFEALCQRIIDLCPGADAIATCQKIEGGFNRVFIFTLDNAKQIVARLPFPLAGPTKLTTASEVATVRYCEFCFIGLINQVLICLYIHSASKDQYSHSYDPRLA